MRLKSGHEVEFVEKEELAKLERDFGGFIKDGLVRLHPGRSLLTTRFLEFADKIYDFKFRNTDVLVNTYAKCGTTWTQEIIWTMKHNPNLDHPKATAHILLRSPFLEFDMMLPPIITESLQQNPVIQAFLETCPGKDMKDGISLQTAEDTADPRIIKTHLPLSLFPQSLLDTTKVVYVARNPKDVVISYHHHCKIMTIMDYLGTFEDFVQYFIDGDVLYGTYWLHLKEAWEKRDHPNLHIIFYEELKANPLQEIRRLDEFLGTKLTDKQLDNVVRHTSFSEMKKRSEQASIKVESNVTTAEDPQMIERRLQKQEYIKSQGGFYRKGEVGDWKNKLKPSLDSKMTEWIQKNFNFLGDGFKYGI